MGTQAGHTASPPFNKRRFVEAVTPTLADSTIFVYAVSAGERDPEPKQIGSGTLVKVGNRRFILTAGHVWSERLKFVQVLGVLVEQGSGLLHFPCPLLNVVSLSEDCLRGKHGTEEWGPDLALIELIGEELGTLNARRTFSELQRSTTTASVVPADGKHTGLWIVTGAPVELTVQHEGHQVVNAGIYGSRDTRPWERGALDYVDVFWDRTSHPNAPKSLGGMSGGGLWHVEDVEENPVPRLVGTAFYASPPDSEGRGFVRCHGPKSVRALVSRL